MQKSNFSLAPTHSHLGTEWVCLKNSLGFESLIVLQETLDKRSSYLDHLSSKMIGKLIQIRDDIHTPLERAVYWTEYVMRHPGAQHLQSPTRFHLCFSSSSKVRYQSYYIVPKVSITKLD